ncbi:unnamed protein product [Miscanthus lutarioriparius]|uniref:Uncharacterized protein n=1 Tax=Miscanthus lutarioriparius TaxID=422564 RepID=A0A811QMY2_9POAL|nr:unnamed protein product [Miscanthus lutarioriparius]
MSSPWKQFGGACRQTRPAQPNPSLIRATFRPDADSAFKSLEPNRAYLQPTLCVDGLLDMPSQGCTNNPQCNAGIHAGNSPAHSTSIDPGSVSSRCSVRLIHDIISKFGPEKVELVRSIGFEGLLHLPLLKQNNLWFSTWLMSRVDELSQTLLIADGARIHFNKADVARVFGIPASRRSIFHKPGILSIHNSTLVTLDSPINTKHLCSIKLKADIANNVKVPYIYGCSLFLQVLYLDSIDLGVLSMEYNIPRIRCFTSDQLRSMIAADSSFSANGCDMVGSRRTKLRPAIGICYHWATPQRSNLGSPNQSGMLALCEASVLMSRILKIPPEAAGPLFVAAADFQRQISSAVGTEALKFMSVLLHIMEPYVNGFSYQSSINAHSPPLDLCSMGHPHVCSYAECCTHFSTIRSKRKSIVCTQIDATINKRQHMINNNDPLNPELPPGSFLDAGDRCINATDVSIQAVLNRHDIDIRAINAMARFYLTLRPVKATRCTDLNTRPHGDDLAATAFHTRAGHPLPGPRSPWDLGCRYTIDLVKASDIHKKLSFVEDIDEPWIVHFCPKYIEVLTCAFKSQFLGNLELEMELVDAVIRRYKQVDDELSRDWASARTKNAGKRFFECSQEQGEGPVIMPQATTSNLSTRIISASSACWDPASMKLKLTAIAA